MRSSTVFFPQSPTQGHDTLSRYRAFCAQLREHGADLPDVHEVVGEKQTKLRRKVLYTPKRERIDTVTVNEMDQTMPATVQMPRRESDVGAAAAVEATHEHSNVLGESAHPKEIEDLRNALESLRNEKETLCEELSNKLEISRKETERRDSELAELRQKIEQLQQDTERNMAMLHEENQSLISQLEESKAAYSVAAAALAAAAKANLDHAPPPQHERPRPPPGRPGFVPSLALGKIPPATEPEADWTSNEMTSSKPRGYSAIGAGDSELPASVQHSDEPQTTADETSVVFSEGFGDTSTADFSGSSFSMDTTVHANTLMTPAVENLGVLQETPGGFGDSSVNWGTSAFDGEVRRLGLVKRGICLF